MASSFTFIPRKVAAKAHAPPSRNIASIPTEAIVVPPLADENKPSKESAQVHSDEEGHLKGKSKPASAQTKLSYKDCAVLIALSLSDYAMWSNPRLRQNIAQSEEKFIAQRYLLRHSPVLAVAGFGNSMKPEESENFIFRSIRAHANDATDIRMIVHDSSNRPPPQNAGLYEIRRKDWKTMLQRPSQMYSKEQWESRTIYMENIPPQSRSVAGIALLTLSLLSKAHVSSFYRVQSILLPPHQQDGPNDLPQCKGFALVILSDMEDVETLLREWPWAFESRPVPSDDQPSREAAKFGLRTLPKHRWDELKEEYLKYQKKNLDELVAFNDGSFDALDTADVAVLKQSPQNAQDIAVEPSATPQLPQTTLDSPFPLNCLIFVRNIHTATNKTTLRKLFSAAFETPSKNGLDYVDYVKGGDTCYLRVTAPHHAESLLEYFMLRLTRQNSGLDDTGTSGRLEDSIKMEIVQGKKEEVYWEKVPESVRWKAVETAVSVQHVSLEDSMETDGGVKDKVGTKARKRRRDQ